MSTTRKNKYQDEEIIKNNGEPQNKFKSEKKIYKASVFGIDAGVDQVKLIKVQSGKILVNIIKKPS